MALGDLPPSSSHQPQSPTATMRPLELLEDEITTLAAQLSAATYRLLELLAEFDRREGWGGIGMRSCAHWLTWKCGISIVTAREKLRVAHALTHFPEIADAMRQGLLSYSKVRAMTRMATRANEKATLAIGLNGTASHVEKVSRLYRRSERTVESAEAAAQHRARELTYYWDDDGCLVIKGRLPAEQGALVVKALQAADEALRQDAETVANAAEAASAEARSPGAPVARTDASAEAVPRASAEASRAAVHAPLTGARPASWVERQADALTLLAETLLAHGPQALPAGDRHLVSLHVNVNALAATDARAEQGAASENLQCHVHDGPAVAREVMRRFACDASVVGLLENERGEVLDVGRKTRAIPPALRRALDHRDRGCRFPGCLCIRFVDAHHVEHWVDGGATRLDNLVLLCRHHHRLVHEGGFALEVVRGEVVVRRLDGSVLEHVPMQRALREAGEETLRRKHAAAGIVIDARTGIPGWGGERADYGYLVDMLAQRDEQRASIESSR